MGTSEDDLRRELDIGRAGGFARRAPPRRRSARERRVREKHPRIGGALLALSAAPDHESAWARGADGEEQLARSLAKRLDDRVILLHDRRVPGSPANIDHLAVTPAGVWVVDAKRYKGKVAISKPLFGQPKLIIGSRDRSKLVDGLAKQVALVRTVVAALEPSVLVRGALCFVDGDLPLLGNLSFNGYPLLYPRQLAKRLNAGGPLSREATLVLAAQLGGRFPSA
jgi:hypothetical protein